MGENDVPANSDGMRVVELEELEGRLSSEMSKHFTDLNLNLTLEDLRGREIPFDIDLDTTPMFLAPSVATLGDTIVSFLDQGVGLWDEESNDLLTTRIASWRQTGDVFNSGPLKIDFDSSFGTGEQKQDYYSDRFLEGLGVVIKGGSIEPREECEEGEDLIVGNYLVGKNFALDVSGTTESDSIAKRSANVSTINYNIFKRNLIHDFVLGSELRSPARINSANEQKVQDSRFNFNILNPNKSKSIFSSKITNRDNGTIMAEMPFQLKAIVASSVGSKEVIYDVSSLNDPMSNSNMLGGFAYNYLLLQRVECLVGYETSRDGDIMLQSPLWRTASLSLLRSMPAKEILCRMTRFEEGDLPSIEKDQGLDLPLYNEFFIVRK